jgi:GAF domain-containing protein
MTPAARVPLTDQLPEDLPMPSMRPLPETTEAVSELGLGIDADHLMSELIALANRAKDAVPDLVGVSIARLQEGVTFTLVATANEIAVLDAVQYVAGGPCVGGAHAKQAVDFENDDVLNEGRWRMFAAATAARAVRSTLTLPVLGGSDSRVVGTVNLYAASGRAFVGHHAALAEIFGAWATAAVSNADLSFETRAEARLAPQRIREQAVVDVAIGILAAQFEESVDKAERRLLDAAFRAGTTPTELARQIVEARGFEDQDDT